MEQEMETKTEKNIEISETKKDENKINPMQEVEIEKMVLHCGGTEDKLEKSIKLLGMLIKSVGIENKVYTVQSTKRIPAFGISPGKKSGAKVTIRDPEKIHDLVERFLIAIDSTIGEKQITTNQVCFGVPEYIEIPGLEYNRDIGILGFEVMIVFKRKGKSVKLRKIKKGKYPKRQSISPEEIENYLDKHFEMEIE